MAFCKESRIADLACYVTFDSGIRQVYWDCMRTFIDGHSSHHITQSIPFIPFPFRTWLTWTWWHLDGWVASGSWYLFRWHLWPFWRPLPPRSVCRGKQPPGLRCPTIASLWYFQRGSPSHLKHNIKFDSSNQLSIHFYCCHTNICIIYGYRYLFLFLLGVRERKTW